MCGHTYEYVSLECSKAAGFYVSCLNKPSSTPLPMSDCQGVTNQIASTCKGPYYQDNMWTGSGYAGVLFKNSRYPDKV
jgi:hypothetical protein